jgi:hypothetical protein
VTTPITFAGAFTSTDATNGIIAAELADGSVEPVVGYHESTDEVVAMRPLLGVVSVKAYGATGDGTDETDHVQAALDAIVADSGVAVFVARGVKFRLAGLTFPERARLLFFADDNLTANGAGIVAATDELVEYFANANPDGIVNESRVAASFHPAHCVDVRKSIAGHDAHLGAGQSRLAPVRGSYNLMDDGLVVGRMMYQQYADAFSFFSSLLRLEGLMNLVTLGGITTGSFASAPTAGTTITGSTSGAKGYLLSLSGASCVVLWVSGTFVTGETVTDNNETSSTTVSSVAWSYSTTQPLTVAPLTGNWSIGLAPGRGLETFNVGGKILSTATRTMGQYLPETVTNPGFVVADDLEAGTVNGFEILYDTSVAAGLRRLYLHKLNDSAKRAHIGAVRAYGNFNNAAAVAASAFNVASVVRNTTGDYTINFTTPFATADYTVALATNQPMDYAYIFVKTTSALRVKVVTTGTTTAVDLTGILEFSCLGGDI